jgi:hypothetical protein
MIIFCFSLFFFTELGITTKERGCYPCAYRINKSEGRKE